MNTLKKITGTILIVGCMVVGPSSTNAQHKLSDQNEMAAPGAINLQSSIPAVEPSVIMAQSTGIDAGSYIQSTLPYFSAGMDAAVCGGEPFVLSGISAANEETTWITDGDGFFDNPHELNSAYFPGDQDWLTGKVTIRLIVILTGANKMPIEYGDSMVITYLNCNWVKDEKLGD